LNGRNQVANASSTKIHTMDRVSCAPSPTATYVATTVPTAAPTARSKRPGRSMGSLARCLEDFFTTSRLALSTDQTERLAAGRRQRRVDQAPEPLRGGVAGFADHQIRARQRALRAGTRPRSDNAIELALAIIRDLAVFLAGQRGKHDWAAVDVYDMEAFLAGAPNARHRRLTVLRQFFRFARRFRLILIDPTVTLKAKQNNAFRGLTLTLGQQRQLFHRWTSGDPDVHPHEALIGTLALLHAASSQEARLLLAVARRLASSFVALVGSEAR
jgi:hypothetical protein